MKNSIQIFSILLILLLVGSGLFAQEEWLVPEAQKAKLSKFEFDEQSRQAGDVLYQTNCKSCHGDPGQANYLTTLTPTPTDPAGEHFQSNLDGELYYKIRTGKGQMPSFRMVLTPNQIWQLIAYLRSFNESYIQEIAEIIEGMESKWDEIEIKLSVYGERGDIKADVTGFEESGTSPVPGVEIQLFSKRTFGNLLLEEGLTNDQGVALFNAPKDLPGNSEGQINLLARLTDEERYGTVVQDTILAVGLPLSPVSLVEERAMWNVFKKAPVWLLLAYFIGVLIVWGLIFFVMVELRSIFKIGQYFEKHE